MLLPGSAARILCVVIALFGLGSALTGCDFGSENKWSMVYSHTTGTDVQLHWFLEGDEARVTATRDGFVFSAGATLNDPASHAVLWSNAEYSGDLTIEYDYTRLDEMMDATSVNILYIQATGTGERHMPIDIRMSSDSRSVPWMRSYFLNMNLLHISYAATGPNRANYVSARRYPASSTESFNSETQISPVFENVALFQPGVTYHIRATKTDSELRFVVTDHQSNTEFVWDISGLRPLTKGRIGFRHMWGRSSRYENIRIYSRTNQQ